MSTWAVPGYTESLELGSGASGRVVLAVHEDTGVPVAVKYLSESLHTRPVFVRDFRAEAQLLGGLESPYVAGLYEYVECPAGAAIVMELVEGVALRALLARRGPLAPEAALAILKGSLLGLADAHRIGVVHRDYKPENVLVMPGGASKLVDFGIAVDSGASGGIAGTHSYMAPEQWRGEPASPAADVYAATATFFECLTGRKPYPGANLAELALQHVDAPVPAQEVPAAVRSLVRSGLAKDPRERPADAEAFVSELEAAAGAGYGPDWEERGRKALAALVAMLPLLLPSARTRPRSTTDTALTVLRQAPDAGWAHSWRPTRPGLLVSGAAAVLAILLAYGVHRDTGPTAGRAAGVVATTIASPASSEHPSSSPSSPSSALPSASAPSASASAKATAGPGGPSASVTSTAPETPPGGGTTGTSTPASEGSATPTSASPTAPAAPAVKDVTVSEFRQTGPTTGTATITVTTDGPGPLSLTLSWFTGNTNGGLGTPDGPSQTFDRSGATRYTISADHNFASKGCYWAVQASTTPVSDDGGASQQILTRQCELR